MKISMEINKATILNIETYKIIERDLFEPIFDGKKLNYKIYSFYYILKLKDESQINTYFDMFSKARLYKRDVEFTINNTELYVLVRVISDDIKTIKESISELQKASNAELEIINKDLKLAGFTSFDEYNLGKFLDTEIDRAVVPLS